MKFAVPPGETVALVPEALKEMEFTVCVCAADELGTRFESPLYDAVTACTPPASEDVVYVAVPMFSVTVPSVVLPSINATVPDALAGVTVAVKVTACEALDGFGDILSTIELGDLTE